jgi:hypothetical protein
MEVVMERVKTSPGPPFSFLKLRLPEMRSGGPEGVPPRGGARASISKETAPVASTVVQEATVPSIPKT